MKDALKGKQRKRSENYCQELASQATTLSCMKLQYMLSFEGRAQLLNVMVTTLQYSNADL